MRRSASEIINNLESRVAKLERKASTRTASGLAHQIAQAFNRGKAYGMGVNRDEEVIDETFVYTNTFDVEVFLDGLTKLSNSENKALIRDVKSKLGGSPLPGNLVTEAHREAEHDFRFSSDLRDELMILGSPKMGDMSTRYTFLQQASRGISMSEEENLLCFHYSVDVEIRIEAELGY